MVSAICRHVPGGRLRISLAWMPVVSTAIVRGQERSKHRREERSQTRDDPSLVTLIMRGYGDCNYTQTRQLHRLLCSGEDESKRWFCESACKPERFTCLPRFPFPARSFFPLLSSLPSLVSFPFITSWSPPSAPQLPPPRPSYHPTTRPPAHTATPPPLLPLILQARR